MIGPVYELRLRDALTQCMVINMLILLTFVLSPFARSLPREAEFSRSFSEFSVSVIIYINKTLSDAHTRGGILCDCSMIFYAPSSSSSHLHFSEISVEEEKVFAML
jgi:hypothetical protein